jgi:hypothetical protein
LSKSFYSKGRKKHIFLAILKINLAKFSPQKRKKKKRDLDMANMESSETTCIH